MAGAASASCFFCQIVNKSTSTTLLHTVSFSHFLTIFFFPLEKENVGFFEFWLNVGFVQDEKVVAFQDIKPAAVRF